MSEKLNAGTFQDRVQPWMMACFGPAIAADTMERNHRFFEEAAELTQACGMTSDEAHQLVDYVWGRPVGERRQEVGGVMVTLAALCLAQAMDMHECGEIELARIWTKVEEIRAKQAAKPKHSPLPEHFGIAPGALADPLDTPIPCDLTVGRVTIRKGCRFRTVKIRMEVLHRMAMENTFPGLKDKTPAEAKSMLDDLIAQRAPSAAQAETDHLLSSPANAAHIARSMEQVRNGQVRERQLVEAEDMGMPPNPDAMAETINDQALRIGKLESALRAIINEMEKDEGHAPGHYHRVLGRWDATGETCDWCVTWNAARALLAAIPPLQISPSSDAGAVTAQDSQDAARYRWLAERYTGWDAEWGRDEANGEPGKEVLVFKADPAMRAPFRRSDLAKSIDAAMEVSAS